MGKRAIIIQARMSSNRLPGKCLKLIGNEPLIFFVIERLRALKLPIIIATSTDHSDDVLVDYLKSLDNILIFRGSLENVLDRYISAASKFDVNEILRITADNPFVDVEAIANYSSMFNKFNYLDGIYNNGWIKGTGFEFVLLNELKGIESQNPYHLEHVTVALRENISKNIKYRKVQVPTYHKFIHDIVLTCDYDEDLELIKQIFENFNYDHKITISEIIKFYKKWPELFKNNSLLHH